DVDAFSVAVIPFDDNLAEVDSNSNLDPLMLSHIGISFRQSSLQRHRAFDRIDAGEFREQSVAHQLENATVVPFDFWFEQLFSPSAKWFVSSRLVLFHESGVTDHVGGKDRRKLPLHRRVTLSQKAASARRGFSCSAILSS